MLAQRITRLCLAMVVILAVSVVSATSVAANSAILPTGVGSISGSVIDVQTGQPLVGVSVAVEGTRIGAMTDVDGRFLIRLVPVGDYTLRLTSIGYTKLTVTGVSVADRVEVSLSLKLAPETVQLKNEIRVTAKAVRNSDAALLKQRRASKSVADAISAETIARSGSGDAAEAMSKVVGATVMEGKYVFVRGLGDRYANTQLNGSILPSSDPNKQAVPMDLISTNLLDNIVVTKSFTPDRAGNFSGGSVDMVTRDFPETQMLSVSTSRGYNSVATSNKAFMTFDNATGDIPAAWNSERAQSLGNGGRAFYQDRDSAFYLSNLSQTFAPDMSPLRRKAPIDLSYSAAYGNSLTVLGRNLGVNATMNYGQTYRYYDDGIEGKYFLATKGATTPTLAHYLHDTKSTDEENLGGLANLAYTLSDKHHLGATYIRNQSQEQESRYLEGGYPNLFNLQPGDTISSRLEAYALNYSDRSLNSLQFKGEHKLNLAFPFRANWLASFSRSGQESTTRFYNQKATYYVDQENPETGDIETVKLETPIYRIDPTDVEIVPTRYFRTIEEDNDEYSLNFTIPLSAKTTFKTGISHLAKTRSHNERRFVYTREGVVTGDPNEYHNSIGVDSLKQGSTTLYTLDNSIYEFTTPNDQYSGTQNVLGVYGMFELPITTNLSLIVGARYESTDMTSRNGYGANHAQFKEGSINQNDLLPSINMVYGLTPTMNLRGAFGRTLARPTLREFAPYSSEDFGGSGKLFNGNPNLRRTLIDNYDLRWEWFSRPDEIIAVSGFYKKFTDPIEVAIVSTNATQLQPQNVDQATVYGAEFEFRRNLGQIHRLLADFNLGLNLTVVHSSVKEPAAELIDNRAVDPGAPDHRPMFGQAPYVVNLSAGYVSRLGTSLDLHYNLIGERLAFNSSNGMADVYERERETIDIVVGQRIWRGLQAKFVTKNLTNSRVRQTYQMPTAEYTFREYGSGRTISLGISCKFD